MPQRPTCPTCGRPMPRPTPTPVLPGQTNLLDQIEPPKKDRP